MEETYSTSAVILGAIVGIVSALIVLSIRKGFGILYGREARNWNALVKLEQLLNTNYSLNHENIALLEGALEDLEKGKIPVFHLRSWEIDTSSLLEINNVDLINDVFSLNIDLKRMNHFAGVTTSLFYDFRKLLLEKPMQPQDFKNTLNSLKKDVENMKEFTKLLENEILLLLAKIHALYKLKGFMRFILKGFTRIERYPEDFETRVREELVSVKEGIEKVVEKRKQKLNTINLKH